jgi:hypothetical protein
MPSSKNYKRNYKQELKTARKRKETAAGSKSTDVKRHKARAAVLKKRRVAAGKEVHHKKPIKSGGSNKSNNLRAVSRNKNRSHGGKIGNRKGKAAGGRKGGKRRNG